MKRLLNYLPLAFTALLFSACTYVEDPGPLQEISKDYSLFDFDELEIGDGFNIEVEQGEFFEVNVRGDRRNINDLFVDKIGSTLVIKFEEYAGRRHQTYISIKMPELRSANFSGGSVSSVSGFNSEEELDFYLSGGSVSQLSAGYRAVNVTLSGGSMLRLHGLGDDLHASLSGASQLSAADFPVSSASLNLSGGSNARVKVSDDLTVTASGASVLYYSGSPLIHKEASGGSAVLEY